MRRLAFALASLIALCVASARAADPPLDPKTEEARAKLSLVLLDEAKVDERTKAVAELAALEKPAAARAFVEQLDRLAARTAQIDARAAKTRQDYERYKGSQSNDKDWAMKQRLLQQMEQDDAVLRNDGAVLDAFAASIAAWKDKEALGVIDRAATKNDLAVARRAIDVGLLKNPAANVKDVGKRAMSDADPTVRLAALVVFQDRKDASFVDYALKSLGDANWTFRQAAARALAALGDTRAVGPLVAQMAAEEGRMLEDFGEALEKLTGAKLGPNADAWKRWYDDHKAEFAGKAPPPPAAPVKPNKNPLLPPVDYYGIETRSLRLLFLIDCSGSMIEKIHMGGTNGDEPKIDIAKRMLKKAVMQLTPTTQFNVITFNTDARQMNEKMILATPENKAQMCGRIDELGARGGTYTYGALKLAFGLQDPNATPSAPPVDSIFVLSDGAPTEATFEDATEAKPMDPAKILDSVRSWNPFHAVKIYSIAIDPRIGSATVGAKFVRFMRDLAAQNGGTYTEIGSQ
jgi:hypothetical protein